MAETVAIPETPGLLSLQNIQALLFGGAPAGSSFAIQNGKIQPLKTSMACGSGTLYTDHVCAERIFRTRIGSKSVVVLSCQEYINEACDETRFHKSIKMSLGVRMIRVRTS